MMSAMLYAQPQQDSILQGQGVPDGVLVGQALTGDQRAFELLVSRYHRPLVRCIRGFLKDDEQVNDVLQHVFLPHPAVNLARAVDPIPVEPGGRASASTADWLSGKAWHDQ